MEKRFYPSSSFWDTYLGRENVIHDAVNIVTLPGEDKPVLALHIRNHPAIECGDVDGAVLGSWVNVNDYADLKEFSQSNLSDGYWACAAVWSDAWDRSTVLSEVSSCLKVLGSLSELDEDKSSMDCEPSVLEKPDKSAGEKTVNIDTYVLKSVQTDDVKTEKLADAKTGGRKGARSDLYVASVSSDVISVSKELWVGSLGNSAAEALVRSKFEEFGPLTNFLFYPSKEFALVEYGNIVHAVRACGYMRGSSIWGGDLQIRYLDRLIGSKGFVGGIAVGESCHIYVGKVKNQKEKDEVFDELKSAGLKRPCGCIDISGENAFILEFETSVDAAVAKAHIRRQAHSDVCSQDKNTSVHQLLVHNMDKSIPETEFINAFSRFGEVSRWQFNRIDGSCLIDYESQSAAACAKSQMHGARFGLKLISVESRTCSEGAVHDKTFSPVIRMPAQNLPHSSSHHEIRLTFFLVLTWIVSWLDLLLFGVHIDFLNR